MSSSELILRQFGLVPYLSMQKAMQDFTNNRDANTLDEIWFLEHPPVFSQGQAGKAEHLLDAGDIPVIQSDRGGQITYHGPGQLIVYFLIDLKRKKISVRDLVSSIENICIDLLCEYQIKSYAKADAPGVYVNEDKISSLGLRVRKGCSFHGLALNINMDLSPFLRINPCGYAGLKMTQTSELSKLNNCDEAIKRLEKIIQQRLGYTSSKWNMEK